MGKSQSDSERTLAISLFDEDFQRLYVCAEYRRMAGDEVAKRYLRDGIDTDYPASQGRVGRRQVYRNHP